MQRLILIRGLPGSGKSTLAKKFANCTHVEADMYFVSAATGEYQFNPSYIKAAHQWCLNKTRQHLDNNKNVVVSNTFTTHWEMQPYLELAKEFNIRPDIIKAEGQWESVHNVPFEVIERMRARWEE